jgi:hypothetical protein
MDALCFSLEPSAPTHTYGLVFICYTHQQTHGDKVRGTGGGNKKLDEKGGGRNGISDASKRLRKEVAASYNATLGCR